MTVSDEKVLSLGPNDTVPCPSDSHRRTALAHGRICPGCEPDEERPARCSACGDTVTALGGVIVPHTVERDGLEQECPGRGRTVSSVRWAA